ncbi:hypothetical protein SAMN04487930_10565 [Cytophaga hutchinsonii ATCC 33406]|jgi:hypothetical protein|nr:hypothetical protein SAMN04487930_10565 [Cytophaga hutchinsonii ATCC 33406]
MYYQPDFFSSLMLHTDYACIHVHHNVATQYNALAKAIILILYI